ncbi:MAG: S8/S53 family peptidase [Salibacteraceae bacterium]
MKFIAFLTFCLLCFFSQAQQNHVEGEVIVKLENVGAEEYLENINRLFPELSAEYKEPLSINLNLHLLTYDITVEHGFSPLKKFSELPTCKFAQWNHTDIEYRKAPNDPSFVAQWSLKNIEAEQAWDITTGGMTKDSHQIVLAVIDESFLLNHDDMIDRYWKNENEIPNNNIDDDNNGYIDDYDGWNAFEDTGYVHLRKATNHGTMISGIIGASTNNSQDISSINWNMKVMPILGGGTIIESVILKAYDYVLTQRLIYNRTSGDSGAYVVGANSSFGVDNGKPENYPAWCEMFNTMGDAGIVSVGAGPNLTINIDVAGDVPCNCPSTYLIGVTRTDINDQLNGGGYGPINMDLGAPGVGVLSLSATNSVTTGTGTSYSAPMVTAALGLMYSAIPYDSMKFYENKPDELAHKVRALLLDNTKAIPTLTNKSTTGGMLNLYRSVLAASNFNDVSAGQIDFNSQLDLFEVYPNPVSDKVILRLNENNSETYNVNVLSSTGQYLFKDQSFSSQSLELDLEGVKAGIYYLHISAKGTPLDVKRIIKL